MSKENLRVPKPSDLPDNGLLDGFGPHQAFRPDTRNLGETPDQPQRGGLTEEQAEEQTHLGRS